LCKAQSLIQKVKYKYRYPEAKAPKEFKRIILFDVSFKVHAAEGLEELIKLSETTLSTLE